MKLYANFYEIPELGELPVRKAAILWKKFWWRDVFSFFVQLIVVIVFIVALDTGLRWLWPQTEPALRGFTAALLGFLLADAAVLPIRVSRFRRKYRAQNPSH